MRGDRKKQGKEREQNEEREKHMEGRIMERES